MMWEKQKGEQADCSNTEKFLSHTYTHTKKKSEGKPLATLTPGGQQGTGNTPTSFQLLYKFTFGDVW